LSSFKKIVKLKKSCKVVGERSDWSRGSGATRVGGAEGLEQGQQRNFIRGSKATRAGGAEQLDEGEWRDCMRGSEGTGSEGAEQLDEGERNWCRVKKVVKLKKSCQGKKKLSN
jgi:hypothetical protein